VITALLLEGSGSLPKNATVGSLVGLTGPAGYKRYEWTLLSKPEKSTKDIVPTTGVSTRLRSDAFGAYLVKLTVDRDLPTQKTWTYSFSVPQTATGVVAEEPSFSGTFGVKNGGFESPGELPGYAKHWGVTDTAGALQNLAGITRGRVEPTNFRTGNGRYAMCLGDELGGSAFGSSSVGSVFEVSQVVDLSGSDSIQFQAKELYGPEPPAGYVPPGGGATPPDDSGTVTYTDLGGNLWEVEITITTPPQPPDQEISYFGIGGKNTFPETNGVNFSESSTQLTSNEVVRGSDAIGKHYRRWQAPVTGDVVYAKFYSTPRYYGYYGQREYNPTIIYVGYSVYGLSVSGPIIQSYGWLTNPFGTALYMSGEIWELPSPAANPLDYMAADGTTGINVGNPMVAYAPTGPWSVLKDEWHTILIIGFGQYDWIKVDDIKPTVTLRVQG